MLGRTWGSLTTEERKELIGGMHITIMEDQKTIYFYNMEKNRCILGTTCFTKGQRYLEYYIPKNAKVQLID